MWLAALARDCIHRAVARAHGAAGASFRLDFILDQRFTDFRWAALLVNMRFVFVPEEAQGADDRGRRALPQAAQRCAANLGAEFI